MASAPDFFWNRSSRETFPFFRQAMKEPHGGEKSCHSGEAGADRNRMIQHFIFIDAAQAG